MSYENLLVNKNAVFCKSVQRFPPETQKGGKISPAAKRFPLSPFREAVKPPLFVPVLRNRLLPALDSPSGSSPAKIAR